jgi:methionyl aminopeptidase
MIIIKSEKEIAIMREGGKLLGQIMEQVGKIIIPGQNTFEINKLARELVFDIGGIPIFEGYGEPGNAYPAAICASINNEIVHGIPKKERIICEGDLVKIDIGMRYKGLITDMARTFPVGKVSSSAQNLLDVTKKCLEEGIKTIKVGAKLSDYGKAVERYAKEQGFSVIRELVGHGVGRELHEDPQIPNQATNIQEVILREGMTLALEPMINAGTRYVKILSDGWTYATKDGELSAHFEDTVVVTKKGVENLTRV